MPNNTARQKPIASVVRLMLKIGQQFAADQ